jgi:hypothetical protein
MVAGIAYCLLLIRVAKGKVITAEALTQELQFERNTTNDASTTVRHSETVPGEALPLEENLMSTRSSDPYSLQGIMMLKRFR